MADSSRETFWHGGRYPKDGILTPQAVMRSGYPGDGFVYITTDRSLAMTYAATLRGSWVMEVEPLGEIEADPESGLETSFRCTSARVLRRYDLPRADRERLQAVMARLGWAP